MKLLLSFLLVSLASGLNHEGAAEDKAFDQFKAKYNRSYGSLAEELYRRNIFSNNYLVVQKHNMEAAAGLHSYTRDWNNEFADENISDVNARLNGYRRDFTKSTNHSLGVTFMAPANVELPEDIDWRKLGAVTEVKNQGSCGSCWAFSATGTLEGFYFRQTGKLVSLSEQQLVDCTRNSKKYEQLRGCHGGFPEIALEYVHDNHGIDTEESYPYQGSEDKCKFNPDKVGAKDKGYIRVTRFDEEALKAAVATMGPISVAVFAGDLWPYKSGVYYEPHCPYKDDQLNHAVLVVGYGKDETTGMDYWLVKNSWGPNWGEEGYVRMARNRNNNCGIATDAIYPLM